MAETRRTKSTQGSSGTVVSDKMNKSIVVRIDRTMKHPLYQKTGEDLHQVVRS